MLCPPFECKRCGKMASCYSSDLGKLNEPNTDSINYCSIKCRDESKRVRWVCGACGAPDGKCRNTCHAGEKPRDRRIAAHRLGRKYPFPGATIFAELELRDLAEQSWTEELIEAEMTLCVVVGLEWPSLTVRSVVELAQKTAGA